MSDLRVLQPLRDDILNIFIDPAETFQKII